MSDEIVPRARAAVPIGQSGNPAGRGRGSRNKATLGEIDEPSPQNVSRATNAVTIALACGEITPGEAATIAGVYETFVRVAGTAKEKVARGNLLRILAAADDVEGEERERGHRRCRSR